MEISKRYIKKFWGIALAVSGLVTTVFIGFATQDTNGMISYYCTVGNSFFGLQLQIYALCPVYVTISSIVVAMSVILLFLLVIAVLIDIFIIFLDH